MTAKKSLKHQIALLDFPFEVTILINGLVPLHVASGSLIMGTEKGVCDPF